MTRLSFFLISQVLRKNNALLARNDTQLKRRSAMETGAGRFFEKR